MLHDMTSRRRALSFLAPIAAIAVLLLSATTVAAHAELVRAIPADGETVTGPVTVVSGRYSQDLADNSRLEIKDLGGATLGTGGVDPQDGRRMVVRPDAPLVDGTFTVESTSVSAEDGDIERLTWTFTVTAPATSAPAPPSPTASGSPASSPSVAASSAPPSASPPASPSPSASPAPTTPTSGGGDVVLPIIAAFAIVAVAAGFLLTRNRSRP
jgi:methionine-rich copper-binding protein CopC